MSTTRQLIRVLEPHSRAVRFWAVYIGAGLALALICGVLVPHRLFERKCVEAKQSWHAVQLALERYAVDDGAGNYPASVTELVGSPYLPAMPVNPFSGQPMRQLQPGDTPRPGDFIYEPQDGGQQPATGPEIEAYTLQGFL